VGDVVHVQMGMYGTVKVKAAGGANNAWTGGPAYDREFNWLMSEMDEAWHDNPPVHDTVTETVEIPPYLPNYFLINGRSETQLPGDSGIVVRGAVNEHIYLRLTNIGFNDDRITFPATLHAQVIDSDGRPLPSAVTTDTLYVSPGERYGVMLDPDAEFTSTIQVDYIDLNTGVILNTQTPPVIIQGFAGVQEQRTQEFLVRPVPTDGPLELICPAIDRRTMIMLHDMGGRSVPLLHRIELSTGRALLDLKGLVAGTYDLQVQCGEKLFSQRIVVH
jgi:FtsP/CotA-like multicopper oxidase with cupredoxin domain